MRAVDGIGRLFAGMASMLDDSAQVAFSSVDGVYYPEAEAQRGDEEVVQKRRFADLHQRSQQGRYAQRMVDVARRRQNGRRLDVKA
jgi:hypothetical protein